jgi:hypothetical protein
MGLFGPYVYKSKNKSKKGEQWWLHMRERGKRRLYFFTRDSRDALAALPSGFEVVENPTTGLPMLKRESGGLFGRLVSGKKKSQS